MVAVAVLFRGCGEAASKRSRWLFRIGWSVSPSSMALPALLRLLSWQGRQATSDADAAATSPKDAILNLQKGGQGHGEGPLPNFGREHIANREQIVYNPLIANCHRPAAEAAPSVPSESRS